MSSNRYAEFLLQGAAYLSFEDSRKHDTDTRVARAGSREECVQRLPPAMTKLKTAKVQRADPPKPQVSAPQLFELPTAAKTKCITQ